MLIVFADGTNVTPPETRCQYIVFVERKCVTMFEPAKIRGNGLLGIW